MTLTFRSKNIVATDRELMIVALDRDIPVIFLVDIATACASLNVANRTEILPTLERERAVLESACRRAYARRWHDREASRVCVDEEDFWSAMNPDRSVRSA